MSYEFLENEFELEAASFGSMRGGPPRKLTGIGVLDPPVPPKRPPGPIPTESASLFARIVAGLVLAGLVLGTLLLLFGRR